MQCVPLSEHPTLLTASIRICRAYKVGVMVDLEAHGLPAATILAEGGVNWDHLLVIQVLSSYLSSATVSA